MLCVLQVMEIVFSMLDVLQSIRYVLEVVDGMLCML